MQGGGQEVRWQNRTNTRAKSASTYGLSSNTSAISFLRIHEVHSSQQCPSQTCLYLTFATFDGELVIMQNDYGSHGGVRSFIQKLKITTHIPIVQAWLELQYFDKMRCDHLIAYFQDIFSSIYTVNLTIYFNYNKEIKGVLQPIIVSTIHRNSNFQLIKQPEIAYLEYPMLLFKQKQMLWTVSLGGILQIFDLNKDKFWLKNLVDEPEVFDFRQVCLSASCNRIKSQLGQVFVMVFNNRQIPYVFVNCKTKQNFQNQFNELDNYYSEGQDISGEITFCQFDSNTSLIAATTANQEIELYQIESYVKSGKNQVFYYCQRMLRFQASQSLNGPKGVIQRISVFKGYLAIAMCEQFILFDLKEKTVIKRGTGGKDKKIEKLKWIQVLDAQGAWISYILAKGYNHLDQNLSKMGKPNIHFKTFDLTNRRK